MDNVVQLYKVRKEGNAPMYIREVAVTKNKTELEEVEGNMIQGRMLQRGNGYRDKKNSEITIYTCAHGRTLLFTIVGVTMFIPRGDIINSALTKSSFSLIIHIGLILEFGNIQSFIDHLWNCFNICT